MADATKSPTCWTRPSDVMKIRRLNLKKKALEARIDNVQPRGNVLQMLHRSESFSHDETKTASGSEKRKNPFKLDLSKRFKSFDCGPSSCDFDASNDTTLFQLLHQQDSSSSQEQTQDSFSHFLEKITGLHTVPVKPEKKKRQSLPVDWSLKSRVRFFSKKNFIWAKNLKTLEEASGTTGFTRCLNLSSDDCGASPSLDTGANAQFHQCCLVWQHPSLPWLNLFPRSGTTAKAASKTVSHPLDPAMRECLQKNWQDSFRSLLQLVRAHQCPYFYVCANKFTCLFRAAGTSGVAEIHALVTPTTSGFRNLLQKDEVVFSMPLRKDARERKTSNSSPPDLGYDTQDSLACSPTEENDSDMEEVGQDEEEEEAEEWLQSMGVAAAQIKKLNSQTPKIAAKANQEDRRPASLIQIVKDEEVQALFNMLLNCNSIVANTGPLAGVPPTLLAPVAYHGATLRPLTVGQRVVNLNGEQFQCVEVSGPVLPHTLRDLCNQLEKTQAQFSVCCTTVDHSKAFSLLPTPEDPPITSAFALENLRDCGLTPHTLHMLCQPVETQVIESVKYTDGSYVCQD